MLLECEVSPKSSPFQWVHAVTALLGIISSLSSFSHVSDMLEMQSTETRVLSLLCDVMEVYAIHTLSLHYCTCLHGIPVHFWVNLVLDSELTWCSCQRVCRQNRCATQVYLHVEKKKKEKLCFLITSVLAFACKCKFPPVF